MIPKIENRWARDMYDHIQGILETLPARNSRAHESLYVELCEQVPK